MSSFAPASIPHFNEREHDAVDSILGGTIRQHTHQEPAAVARFNFAFDRLQPIEDLLHVLV